MGTPTAPFENNKAFGVYIHFPYCEKLCSYCDFVVSANPRIPHREYAEAVLQELEHRAKRFEGLNLVSIYFGGGTPSLWDPFQIKNVIKAVATKFGGSHLREVTMEANPSPKLSQTLESLQGAGISRISLGVQTLQDSNLNLLNRSHTSIQALEDLEGILANTSFKKTSADLIYGLPGSTVDSVTRDTQKLCDMGIKHLSLYALTVEDGTPLNRAVQRKKIIVPEDDRVADQAEAVWETANRRGLFHYEISSCAVPGNEAIHNSLYWHQRAYMGLGVGAHGLEPISDNQQSPYQHRVYRQNTNKIKDYLKNPTRSGTESAHDRESWLQDLLIVRPRWLHGFRESEIYTHTLPLEEELIRREIQTFIGEGILIDENGKLRLSPRGVLFADAVTERLVSHIGHQASR